MVNLKHGGVWWGFVIEVKEERVDYNLPLEAFAQKWHLAFAYILLTN